MDAGNYGIHTTGKLVSPLLIPVKNKQRCLIFSYKVAPGTSLATPILQVFFGGIPHWSTSEGEGRVIIGLYSYFIVKSRVSEFNLWFLEV